MPDHFTARCHMGPEEVEGKARASAAALILKCLLGVEVSSAKGSYFKVGLTQIFFLVRSSAWRAEHCLLPLPCWPLCLQCRPTSSCASRLCEEGRLFSLSEDPVLWNVIRVALGEWVGWFSVCGLAPEKSEKRGSDWGPLPALG